MRRSRYGGITEQGIRMLIIQPLLDSLRFDFMIKQIQLRGDRKRFTFVVDIDPKHCVFFLKGVEDQGVTIADHRISNFYLGCVRVELQNLIFLITQNLSLILSEQLAVRHRSTIQQYHEKKATSEHHRL